MIERRREGAWTLSKLARKRAAQYSVDLRLLPLAARYGKRLYLQGDMHVFVGRKMIPDGVLPDDALKRIRNTMLVVAPDGMVKTVWKDARTLRRIRRRRFRTRGYVRRRMNRLSRHPRWRAPDDSGPIRLSR